MAVNVYVPTPFRDLTGGLGHVQADGLTVSHLIDNLERQFPGLGDRIRERGQVRLHVNVFVNGHEMRCLRGDATELRDGDEVAFIPALVGGCPAPIRSRSADFSFRETDDGDNGTIWFTTRAD